MKLLDGKVVSNCIKESLKDVVSEMDIDAKLAVIKVGNDEASSVYVKNKEKACEHIGIKSEVHCLSEGTSQEYLAKLIDKLNNDRSVTGILVQLPLPNHINEQEILTKIDPRKDVDGFHPCNVGNLVLENKTILPCTPAGIMQILKYYDIPIAGKECVIVGRSNIVGKPMALLMLHNDATVTVCHSKTENLKEVCKRADILICAIGKPKFFDKEYIKDGAVVIDVGIHRQDDGKLCGDVDFDSVKDIVSAITPVPGGCGQTTIAMLMSNCVETVLQ